MVILKMNFKEIGSMGFIPVAQDRERLLNFVKYWVP
jgi:hypothetical protein